MILRRLWLASSTGASLRWFSPQINRRIGRPLCSSATLSMLGQITLNSINSQLWSMIHHWLWWTMFQVMLRRKLRNASAPPLSHNVFIILKYCSGRYRIHVLNSRSINLLRAILQSLGIKTALYHEVSRRQASQLPFFRTEKYFEEHTHVQRTGEKLLFV